MKELTCSACLRYDRNFCLVRHIRLPPESNICPFFAGNNDERPRFCKLASSVDNMAKALVCKFNDNGSWLFTFREDYGSYETEEEAIAAAKAWLMEVE